MSALRSRANRRAKGKCRYCSAPARPGHSTCAKHGERERERKAALPRAATQTCKRCGKAGHNRRNRNCPKYPGGRR